MLRHFPREVGEAFERLRTTGDAAALEMVIHAVVRDHIPAQPRAAAAALTPSTALIDDLGFDSMAISELVFFFEDLFRFPSPTKRSCGCGPSGNCAPSSAPS